MNMWWQFGLQNLWFAVNMFGAMVFLAVFWLYLDAYLQRHHSREWPRLLGYGLLAGSFALAAAGIDMVGVRVAGYLGIIIGLLLEPLQPKPKYETAAWSWGGLNWPVPTLAALTGLLYWRRATIGLERHIKPMAYAFFVLGLAELGQVLPFFQNTHLVWVYQWVRLYGWIWLAELMILLVGLMLAFKWVWRYLLMRLVTQLMLIFSTGVFVIFLLTTMIFTGLLLKSIEAGTIRQLMSDGQLVLSVVESRQVQVLGEARSLAADQLVGEAIAGGSSVDLVKFVSQRLNLRGGGMVWVANKQAQVIARGEEPDRMGDSVSEDILFQRALAGEEVKTVRVVETGLMSTVWAMAAIPVTVDEEIKGVVIWGMPIGRELLEPITQKTGLAVSVWAGNKLVETTINEVSVVRGMMETGNWVIEGVLNRSEVKAGAVKFGQQDYYAAYAPLVDLDQVVVGMVSVGVPQTSVFTLADEAMKQTFGATIILMLACLIPAYLVAKKLADQLH